MPSDVPPAPVDADLPALHARVDEALADFLRGQERLLTGIDAGLGVQLRALGELLAGGKRLRPAFCYWGWRGAGGSADDPGIVVAAAALELLQASALIHDDVIDASDVRRGKPAAHRRFAALHHDESWSGSPDQFGVGAAILLGDLCLSWSDEMLRTCGLPGDRLLPALRYFDLMRTEVAAGQYLDLLTQASGRSRPDQVMRVVRYKAAKYTVERPLHLGGALAGGTPDLLAACSAYGLPVGEAFQLRDDVLGVFGDPQVTGKPAGDDLREGKQTMLVARTLAAATEAQARRFHADFGRADLDERGVAELRELMVQTKALASVEALIDELTERAVAELARAAMPEEARAALTALALAATRRRQ